MSKRLATRKETASSTTKRTTAPSWHDLQQLARGLSHEILNPLAAIKAAVEVLRDTEAFSRQGRETVCEIDGEIEQIDRVIRQFMAFTFCPAPALASLPLEAVLESTPHLLREEGEKLKIKVEASRELMVRADLTMLQRVLSELLQNCVEHGAGHAAARAQVHLGQVVITLSNDGSPVPPDVAPHVFEPFFSTRPRCAGLGLPIARRWLAVMQGTIDLLPMGDGFEIRLPQGTA